MDDNKDVMRYVGQDGNIYMIINVQQLLLLPPEVIHQARDLTLANQEEHIYEEISDTMPEESQENIYEQIDVAEESYCGCFDSLLIWFNIH